MGEVRGRTRLTGWILRIIAPIVKRNNAHIRDSAMPRPRGPESPGSKNPAAAGRSADAGWLAYSRFTHLTGKAHSTTTSEISGAL